MKHIFLNKDEIQLAIQAGNTCDGDRYLIVSPAGDWRVAFVQRTRTWDPWGPYNQVFCIPPLFPDGSGTDTEEAEACIQTYQSLPVAHDIMGEADISAMEYCEKYLSDEWQAWQAERIEWIAEEFLSALNEEPNALQDEFYAEQDRQFIFHWYTDLQLSQLSAIVADVEQDDVHRVKKKLSARIAKGMLKSYLPDKYPVIRPDGKRGKVRMIPIDDAIRTVRLAEWKRHQ